MRVAVFKRSSIWPDNKWGHASWSLEERIKERAAEAKLKELTFVELGWGHECETDGWLKQNLERAARALSLETHNRVECDRVGCKFDIEFEEECCRTCIEVKGPVRALKDRQIARYARCHPVDDHKLEESLLRPLSSEVRRLISPVRI